MRRERWFKWAIAGVTLAAMTAIATFYPWGRQFSRAIDAWAFGFFRRPTGRSTDMGSIEESWRVRRAAGIAETRPRVEHFFARSDEPTRRLLRYAGMDPEHGLLRWGNFDWTLLLSSKVFEADDTGRSYRLRPLVRSVWLRGIPVEGNLTAFFLVPDGPGLTDALRGTTAVPLESSRQTTNSWGVRGPEPEPGAPVRGIVLGDSFMQGMFIGDDDTPPECLRRDLESRVGTRISILNAGLMGYSPEQYYYTLMALAGRFRPQFVVVSVCANDFGDPGDLTARGLGDLEDGRYWLEKIVKDSREHDRICLVVPVPHEPELLKRRRAGFYPGVVANLVATEGVWYLDVSDAFLDEHLRSRIDRRRSGRPTTGCTLFNDEIHDTHFSPLGSRVWADAVGRRLALLLEDHGAIPHRASHAERTGSPGG